jgi:hypothetical protein
MDSALRDYLRDADAGSSGRAHYLGIEKSLFDQYREAIGSTNGRVVESVAATVKERSLEFIVCELGPTRDGD